MSSRLGNRGKRHDRFFKQARKEGYAARSVYKLEELDQKFRLIRRGHRVLDLGCRPGSWLQYARDRVGSSGHVIGIDRDPLPADIEGTRVLVGDIRQTNDEVLLCGLDRFDVVMSDMAPDTTGIRSADQARSAELVQVALDCAERLLGAGGHFVAKVFEGPEVNEIRSRIKSRFAAVHSLKPEGTRKASTEIYLVGKGFEPNSAGAGGSFATPRVG